MCQTNICILLEKMFLSFLTRVALVLLEYVSKRLSKWVTDAEDMDVGTAIGTDAEDTTEVK